MVNKLSPWRPNRLNGTKFIRSRTMWPKTFFFGRCYFPLDNVYRGRCFHVRYIPSLKRGWQLWRTLFVLNWSTSIFMCLVKCMSASYPQVEQRAFRVFTVVVHKWRAVPQSKTYPAKLNIDRKLHAVPKIRTFTAQLNIDEDLPAVSQSWTCPAWAEHRWRPTRCSTELKLPSMSWT